MRRIATGRIVGLVLVVAGIGVAILFASAAVRGHAEFRQWQVARPMEAVIDLSQAGEVTVPFQQTCDSSHGVVLCSTSDLDDESEQNLEELFKDLSAQVIIKDSGGVEVDNISINSKTIHQWGDGIILAGVSPFPKGDYVATIRVDSGTSVLANGPQAIHAEYQLCGLELMPAHLAGIIALGAGIVGLASLVWVLPGLIRFGIWREVPAETKET